MRPLAALFVSLLSLPLFAAISGTVMTSDGVAVAGARVSIHALETPEARRARLFSKTPDAVPLSSVQTDDKGSFSLASPKEPVVELRVDLHGYEPFVRRVERDAESVAVALRKSDMVKGSVTAGGKPVAGALVMLGADYVTRTDEQGRYEAPAILPPYILAVIHPDYAIDEEMLPTGAQPAREWQRTLSAGVTLTGRAVAADGTSPVAGAEISVDGWPLAVSGQDGAFRIAHAPATWRNITARKGTLAGSHTAGGTKTIVVRLEPSAVLSGTVRDSKTNAPLGGVVIGVDSSRVPGMDGPAAITDARGAYSMAVPAGSFGVSTRHPSYAMHHVSVSIAPGQQETKDLAPTRFARVSGVVLDESGRPVAAATVSPEKANEFALMDMQAMGATPVTAGPDGKFSLPVMPGHDFHVRASRSGLPRARSEILKLSAGEHKRDVVLTLPAGVAVTGRALDARGKPLAGVSVIVTPTPPAGGIPTLSTHFPAMAQDPVRSVANGTFALRMQEGTYDFTFRRDGYLRTQVRAQRITAGGRNAIEARLDPAEEISGRVTRGGVGIAGVEVGSYGATDVRATTASDGSFVLGGFSPGVKQLELRKSAELIHASRSITVPARGVVIDLPTGGTIRGRVVEKGTNAPIRSFRAGVTTGLGNLRSFGSEDGSFTLEHVPPGAMTLIVNAFGYVGTHRDVDVVNGGSPIDLVIELDLGVRLTGRVTDANGAPLSGVTITVPPPAPGGMIGGTLGGSGLGPRRERPVPRNNATTVTDADGRYTLDGLVPKAESVHFAHPGHVPTTRRVTLEGREIKLDVQLTANRAGD